MIYALILILYRFYTIENINYDPPWLFTSYDCPLINYFTTSAAANRVTCPSPSQSPTPAPAPVRPNVSVTPVPDRGPSRSASPVPAHVPSPSTATPVHGKFGHSAMTMAPYYYRPFTILSFVLSLVLFGCTCL